MASRALAFFAVWLAVAGWQPKDALVGAAAALVAGALSQIFYPRLWSRIGPRALARLAFNFFKGSIVAGFDVARRSLAPDMRLKPGFVAVPLVIPQGLAQNAFSALSSLQPGTLPTGAEGDQLIVHALDTTQPVAETMLADERLFMRAFGYE